MSVYHGLPQHQTRKLKTGKRKPGKQTGDWQIKFFQALAVSGDVKQAAGAAGVAYSTVTKHRRKTEAFDRCCAELVEAVEKRQDEQRGQLRVAAGWGSPPPPAPEPTGPRTHVRGRVIFPFQRQVDLVVDAPPAEALQLVEQSIQAEAADQLARQVDLVVQWFKPPVVEEVAGDG